ncbi:MAG: serine/threonine protein kinase [Clostridia bacterium]|nr:serine/threonine protein kinase [Clostridia bacterium]
MSSLDKSDFYKQYEGKILDDRYVLERLIGVGGMAVVFRARDKYLNNMTVAIKMLKDREAQDEVVVKRFKNEGRAQSMLKQSNIVSVREVNIKGEIKYMVMEYIYGITLKNYLTAKAEPLDYSEILGYTAQILRALHHAHENKIIHRDIKPQNIMVLQNGQVKVMDFGIAKLPNTETITVTDKAVGTVYYMSPEQASGKKVDHRSDIYSLGAMMYELATGVTPFRAETPFAVLVKHINEPLVPPRQLNSSIPVGLEQIIMCAMSKDPAQRFQSAAIMLDYVKQIQKNKKVKFEELPSNSFWQNFVARLKRIFSKKKSSK